MMSLCRMRCKMPTCIHLDQKTRFRGHAAAAGWGTRQYHDFYLFIKASIKMITSPVEKNELATCSERLLHHHSGHFMTCLGFITFFLTTKEQILLNFPAFSGNDYMIGAPDYF